MYFRRRVSASGVKLYAYSCHREGKQVIRKYIGTATARDEENAKSEREEKRELRRAKREQRNPSRDEFEHALDARLAELRDLAAAALIANGWHLHKRQWRSRRRGRPVNGR